MAFWHMRAALPSLHRFWQKIMTWWRLIWPAWATARCVGAPTSWREGASRSEEHTSELQSLLRISYAVFCLKKNNSADDGNDKESSGATTGCVQMNNKH